MLHAACSSEISNPTSPAFGMHTVTEGVSNWNSCFLILHVAAQQHAYNYVRGWHNGVSSAGLAAICSRKLNLTLV